MLNGVIEGCTFDLCGLEGDKSQDSFRCLAYEQFTVQCNNLLFENGDFNLISNWRSVTNCRECLALNKI